MLKAREIVIVCIIIRGLFHFIVTISRELRLYVLEGWLWVIALDVLRGFSWKE